MRQLLVAPLPDEAAAQEARSAATPARARPVPHRWTRADAIAATALGLLVLVLRIPFRSRFLNGWDSGSFALAIEEYDVLAQRPHAPGYPVYVAAAKVLQPFFGEANATLVALSILFSAAAVVSLYGFCREFASLRAAIVGCVLFVLTPNFSFNGVIALSYTAEAFASTGIAWLAWRLRAQPTLLGSALLGAATALGVGLRPSIALYLLPLVLYAMWPRQEDWRTAARRFTAAAGAGAIVAFAWAIPMVLATSHGLAGWRLAMRIQSEWVVFAEGAWSSGLHGITDRFQRLAFFLKPESTYLVGAIGLAVLATIVASSARFRATRPWTAWTRFMLAWIGPTCAFYILVFDGWDKGPTGYVLVLLPAVYAALARLADALLQHARQHPINTRSAPVTPWLIAALLLAPGVGYWHDGQALLRKEVQAHDQWADQWSELSQRFPPNETAILTFYSWSHVKWYFPEYLAWGYFPIPRSQRPPDWELFLQTQHHQDDVLYYEAHERGPGQPEHPIPNWIRTIVIFDFQLAGENGEPRRLAPTINVTEEHLPSGMRLLAFVPDGEHATIESCFIPLPAAF
jgi:hypothetical protein